MVKKIKYKELTKEEIIKMVRKEKKTVGFRNVEQTITECDDTRKVISDKLLKKEFERNRRYNEKELVDVFKKKRNYDFEEKYGNRIKKFYKELKKMNYEFCIEHASDWHASPLSPVNNESGFCKEINRRRTLFCVQYYVKPLLKVIEDNYMIKLIGQCCMPSDIDNLIQFVNQMKYQLDYDESGFTDMAPVIIYNGSISFDRFIKTIDSLMEKFGDKLKNMSDIINSHSMYDVYKKLLSRLTQSPIMEASSVLEGQSSFLIPRRLYLKYKNQLYEAGISISDYEIEMLGQYTTYHHDVCVELIAMVRKKIDDIIDGYAYMANDNVAMEKDRYNTDHQKLQINIPVNEFLLIFRTMDLCAGMYKKSTIDQKCHFISRNFITKEGKEIKYNTIKTFISVKDPKMSRKLNDKLRRMIDCLEESFGK